MVAAWMVGAALLCPWQTPRVETLQRAAALIEQRQYAAAEDALAPLLGAGGSDPLALNLLGVLRMREQRADEAEALFRRAISGGHLLPGPHVNLALLYGTTRPLEAIAELGEALRIAPENKQARELLLSIVKSCRPRDYLAITMKAREALPHDPEVAYLFALAALDSGLAADAAQALAAAIESRPDFADARYALARAWLALSKPQDAEGEMRVYLAGRPEDATAHYGLGYILAAEQKAGEAAAEFERSLAIQPRQSESLFQLGELALQGGDVEGARRRFEAVLAAYPEHAGALAGMGILAYRAQQFADAEVRLRTAVRRAPDYQKAHYYYALTLAKLGRKDEAAREFEAAKKLDSRSAPELRLESAQP